MKHQLELHVTLAEGRERECAEFLRGQVKTPQWRILAALAAEIVALHESSTAATAVVVVGADQAERVLADLARSGKPAARG